MSARDLRTQADLSTGTVLTPLRIRPSRCLQILHNEGGPVAGNRLMIAVLDQDGREATIDISIRKDTVECWSHNRCRAIFVREQLRVWLAAPFGCYAADELLLAQTTDGISLLIDGQIPWHPLAPHVLDNLRQRIRDRMSFAPRGLLLGLINVAGLTPTKRAAVRISLALAANEKGYALVETFEVTGDSVRDEGTYAAIEDLASQIDTQAVMVMGDIDLDRVQDIARRVRLVVRTVY